MKKLMILICFAMMISGCGKKEGEKKITYSCNGILDAIDIFYEDDEYSYYIPTQSNYIIYGDEQIGFSEAIARKIVTKDDICKNCSCGKMEK